MLIEAQLDKRVAKSPTPEPLVPWIPLMLERAELASLVTLVDIRSPGMRDSRIAAIQAMADLCSRVEPSQRSSGRRGVMKREDLYLGNAVDDVEVAEANLFPVRCDELQCLFCIGDEKLNFTDRTRIFCRLQKLWEHAEKHLRRLAGVDIWCPYPRCNTRAVTLDSIEHLLNHAQREHNIRLRCR